ncbi:MAG: pectate lyase [Bacteroides sp.]|nr:pectate lyase [Prevotella sp.]MCM1408245.1 hypothetical protein [Treponema brennaborense]MCM1469569.1 pectate lyase [Bacteroides sp.]
MKKTILNRLFCGTAALLLLVAGCKSGDDDYNGTGGDITDPSGNGSDSDNTGSDPSVPGGVLQKPIEIVASGSLDAKAGGWLESAWIEWKPVSADVDAAYNVYVKGENLASWTKIDNELIRGYNETAGSTTVTYFRADALGLKAGTYDMKVELADDTMQTAEVSGITVLAHDRSGFAHFGYTKGIGAYNDDGTLKTGAKVVYVTKDNAKTVTATVKTGSNKSEEFKGMQAIINAYQKGADTTPITFRIIGVVSKDDMDALGSSEEGLQIKGKNANSEMNITVEGVGEDAVITGFGILVRNSSSVELRNFAVIYCMDDCVSIDTGDSRLWVHNLDLFYGPQGSGDHAKGDGSLDSKNATMSTYSYNHFWDSGKCNLLENGSQPYSYASGSNYLTYHHNWYDHSDSRHPRVRYDNVHVYNNYYDGNSKYGVGSTNGSSVFVENNYFRNCKFPMLTSMQGNDVYAGTKTYKEDNGTFSSEDGGTIKAYNNYMTGNTMSYAAYAATSIIIKGSPVDASGYFDTKTHFDAYEVANRTDKVPNTLHPVKGTAHYYSNFDTDSSIMYTYKVDTPDDAKTNVENFAGRMNGGDILRKTDMYDLTAESEDTNHELIPGFVTFLKSYKSKLVSTNVTADSSSSTGGSGSTGTSGSGTTGDGSSTTTTETPATITYPTATLKAGTISDFTATDINWTLIANSTSSSIASKTQVNVFPGAYLAFHLDKEATLTFETIGNKPGKIVSSTGTASEVAQSTNVSVKLPAGNYYFTSAHAEKDSRIKGSITVTYTN